MSPPRSGTPAPGPATLQSIAPAPAAGRQASGSASSCLSVGSPIAPDVARINALRRLIFATVRVARRHQTAGYWRAGLPGIVLRRRPPGFARRRRVAVVVVIVIVRGLARLEEAERIGIGLDAVVVAAARRIDIFARYQLVLGVDHLAVAVDAQAFGDRPAAGARRFAGLEI